MRFYNLRLLTGLRLTWSTDNPDTTWPLWSALVNRIHGVQMGPWFIGAIRADKQKGQ